MRPLLAFVMALVLLLTQSACYDWEMVKPVELPKLNGSFSQPIGQVGRTTVVGVSVADVERPDGTLTQIHGKFDLRIVRRDGSELTFEHPVSAELEGDELVLRGGNRPATRLRVGEIDHAEVSQYSVGKTMAVALIGTVVVTAVIMAVVLGSLHKDPGTSGAP